jgi:hypothetical protein
MNHICTWLCVDGKGEESLFPQTGRLSSSEAHQHIYWRCLLVFFITSKRFNKTERHLLFTNAEQLPVVDGRDVRGMLDDLGVEIIKTPFRYKTPKGYFGMFQNQFYEFSILEYIAGHGGHPDDQYLILDSDCLFLRPVADLFREAAPSGFISFEDEVSPEYVINGLSRNDLRQIYGELLGYGLPDIPSYHLGEFLLCSEYNIRRIYADFQELWPLLLARHYAGLPKFNEEAHTLSYLYYKNGLFPSPRKNYMKRIWTNPLFYRNVEPSDTELAIWHLPAEKTFGIARLYALLMGAGAATGHGLSMGVPLSPDDGAYRDLLGKTMGVPVLPARMRLEYYIKSCYRAMVKRWGLQLNVQKLNI